MPDGPLATFRVRPVKREPGRRRAGVLVILAAACWWHVWLPALFVVALVVWALLHRRLEGTLGEGVLRLWHRVWPLPRLVLATLIVVGGITYWVSDAPLTVKVMPIMLNLLALSTVAVDGCRRVVARGWGLRGAGTASAEPSGLSGRSLV